MANKRRKSFTELLNAEREQIRQNPELMDEIERKLEERLSSGVMRAAEE
ncbi:FbpB family small basic protein [Salirhabdus salicampi]|nr:FbpB family small basic protein [Salirhabdus salicampi]MCP8616410.1 FbpB family small basic protein [Salirhabdus salicampi]